MCNPKHLPHPPSDRPLGFHSMWWRTTRKSCCSWPLCVSVPCAVMTDDYSKQYVKFSDYPSAGLDGCPKDPSVVAKFKWEMTLMWKLQEHCSYYLAHQCQSNRKFKIEHMWEEINKFPCRIIISRRGTRQRLLAVDGDGWKFRWVAGSDLEFGEPWKDHWRL